MQHEIASADANAHTGNDKSLTALIMANFKLRSPASRAIVGVTLGWLLSGFISAAFDALSSGAEFALLPNAWLLGLAPLVVVYVPGWIIHQRQR